MLQNSIAYLVSLRYKYGDKEMKIYMDWPQAEEGWWTAIKDRASVESSRKQRKWETTKQLEEIHSESNWKKLEWGEVFSDGSGQAELQNILLVSYLTELKGL
jgi:hypothetical protein